MSTVGHQAAPEKMMPDAVDQDAGHEVSRIRQLVRWFAASAGGFIRDQPALPECLRKTPRARPPGLKGLDENVFITPVPSNHDKAVWDVH